MKQFLVVSALSVAVTTLWLPSAGRVQAQNNDNSLTVEGGVGFINPGIPVVTDAKPTASRFHGCPTERWISRDRGCEVARSPT